MRSSETTGRNTVRRLLQNITRKIFHELRAPTEQFSGKKEVLLGLPKKCNIGPRGRFSCCNCELERWEMYEFLFSIQFESAA